VVKRGDSLRYGDVEVSYDSSGRVEACDRYGCLRFHVVGGKEVVLKPVPPLRRPRPLSNCLYLEFPEPLLVGGGVELLVSAPFELEVSVGGVVAGYLSPRPVKHTLVGDVVDGVVCRYYRSRVIDGVEGLEDGEGVVKVRFRGDSALVPALAFYIVGVSLVFKDGVVCYPDVEASISRRTISVRVSGRGVFAQQRHRHVVQGRLLFTQTFVMEV